MNYPVKMSLDEFYARNGCPYAVSGYSLDKFKLPYGKKDWKARRDDSNASKELDDYYEKRKETKRTYYELVDEGKIIPKTSDERMIEKAQGHSDNESVQAARRMCLKKGIDWKTGNRL